MPKVVQAAPSALEDPLLDLLTHDEIHRALVRHVLMRKHQEGLIQVDDVDDFMTEHHIQSRVFYRDVKHGNEVVMEAAVSIDRATPKPTPKNAPTSVSESQGE